MNTTIPRDDDGTLPHYAWPGGYALRYICEDGGLLCATCANLPEASTDADTEAEWRIVARTVLLEGPPMECDHCGELLESEHGDTEETP